MNIDKANEIALNWISPDGFEEVIVDVAKTDELFKRHPNYLAPDAVDSGREDRRDKCINFMDNTPVKQIHAPVVFVTPDNLIFCDGRHRYAVLRDMGVKKMKLAAFHPSGRIAEALGILAA